MNRYAADYFEPTSRKIHTPELSDLTTEWIASLSNPQSSLPLLSESLQAHRLMFDWLEHSKFYKNKFPIT
jgi:hypothetical protein